MLRHENVQVSETEADGYVAAGLSFRFLKIEDNNKIDTLRAGVSGRNGYSYDYAKIDITIGDGLRGNLQNKTVEKYKERIEEIFVYLEAEYGIEVNVDELQFDLMEINVTIPLKDEFYKYHRVLQLFIYNLPNSYKKINETSSANKKERRRETETLYRKNTSMAIKVYNKSCQLRETIGYQADKEYLRIELVLQHRQKVKEVFGTNSIEGITDTMINDFFMKEFRRLFVESYRKWQKDNGKRLESMIKKRKKHSPKHWISNLIRECANREQADQIPVLLDVNDLLVQVKALDKSGHYQRTKAGILRACVKDDVFLQDDSEKVEEIFDLVYEAYDNCVELE